MCLYKENIGNEYQVEKSINIANYTEYKHMDFITDLQTYNCQVFKLEFSPT